MLGFFHRHQKSLMLILLVPALLAMGITGAVMSVISHQGDQVAGRVYGQEINQLEFQRIRAMFQSTNPQAGDEEAWRFYALLRTAEGNGIDVSRDEVGKNIQNTMRFSIAQNRALEELRKQNVDVQTEEGRRKFQQIYFRYVLNDDLQWDTEEYEETLRRTRGMNVREFEAQEIREAKVQSLLEVLRDMGTVDPDDVWKAYQDEHHLRALGLVEIAAADYRPDLDAVEAGKGHVSDQQVQLYYAARKADYDQPRRVDMAFAGVRFEDAEGEVEAPSVEQLEAFNEREGIAAVGSFAENEDKIRDLWFEEQARLRVETIMDAFATRIEKAKLDKEPIDLAAITSAVKTELKSEVVLSGQTGLVTEEDLAKEGLLTGWASRRWFRVKAEGECSEVLGGDKGWFVLHSKKVEFARTPKFDEIEAQVRQDYARGSEKERKAYYQDHQSDYLLDKAWVVEAALAKDSAFEGNHDKARDAVNKAVDVSEKWEKPWPLKKFEVDPDVPQLEVKEWERITRSELDEDAILKRVASEVATSPRAKLSRVFEYEGGWAVFRVVKQLQRETQPYEEVKEQVAEAVALERAVERAEQGAQTILADLRNLRGDALQKALEKRGLKERVTEAFARTATSIEGVEDGSRFVAEAFSAEAEVGGTYEAVVPDPSGKRVFLVRVAKRVDAPADGFAAAYQALRKDLLSKKRMDYAENQRRKLLLFAKGVSDELVSYATEVRDGPSGEYKLTFRQIFLPPDREIIDGWLETEARKKLAKAKEALDKKTSWPSVVDAYSEHELSRRAGGELAPQTREELSGTWGIDFSEAVFVLPRGQLSAPIKSSKGMHLVRLLADKPDGRKVFQHVMVSLDPKIRLLPDSVRQQAKEASRKKLVDAAARIAKGEGFSEVAFELGDTRDPYGQGQELEVGFTTHLERAALGQYLEFEPPEGHPNEGDMTWVPDVVEVPGPKGVTYHLFACQRDRDGDAGFLEDSRWTDRKVFHIASSNKADVERARSELISRFKSMVASDQDRSWYQIEKHFGEVAADYSKVPTAKKGGALGSMSLHNGIRPYGGKFLEAVCYPGGAPATAGKRTEVFESEAGFHLVEILEVETSKPDARERFGIVAERILNGTGWK
ncbi:MAG TPA: hypothetical protein DEA08_15095 [Planctomycetes bacterium]|nr:hypothetical protein [Planctomycetota bacterium]